MLETHSEMQLNATTPSSNGPLSYGGGGPWARSRPTFCPPVQLTPEMKLGNF